MSNSTFYLVFPGGDRTRISVVELANSRDYELNDYAVASRKNFCDEAEAREYGRELAELHGLVFNNDGYLD